MNRLQLKVAMRNQNWLMRTLKSEIVGKMVNILHKFSASTNFGMKLSIEQTKMSDVTISLQEP